jgi:hypothetical protein
VSATTTQPMGFGNAQASGDSILAGASPLAVNVLVDGKGAVRRRPGISAWAGFPASPPDMFQVDGIQAYQGSIFWVNSQRRIYRVDPATATAYNMSAGGVDTYLAGSGRPVFADTPFRLVIAGGAAPQKVDTGAASSDRLGGSPPDSTQVIALNSRLFSDDLTDSTAIGAIRASGLGNAGNETWDPLDFVRADARTDGIAALRENGNEVYAWGDISTQVFSPDATAILAPGRAVQRGIAAAHSIIRNDENFAWLTELGAFVDSDGRTQTPLSDPIAATIEAIITAGNAADCWGFRLNMDQFDCLVWVFPRDGRAFCYQKGGGWSQWHGWSGTGLAALPITAHHLYTAAKTHLVGTADGQIAKFDSAASTDLGETIKAHVRTGFQNRGTHKPKHCAEASFTFLRGRATGDEPAVSLSWRDSLGGFCDPIRIGLGTTGDDVFTVRLHSLGVYRAREWQLEFTDAADFVLASAEETFTVEDA